MADEVKAMHYDARENPVVIALHLSESKIQKYANRFCIVSTETGEILDNANGYGYTTASGAHASYAYKTRDTSKDEEKRIKEEHIREWADNHAEFMKAMSDTAFGIAKGAWGGDAVFNVKVVKKLLKKFGLEPDFTATDLLKFWKKM